MKKILLLMLLYINNNIAFNQNEQLIPSAAITFDNVNNLNGGIKQGSSFMALLDVSLNYKPENVGFLKNTEVFVHLLKTAGQGASENYIGDAQVASNIEGKTSAFIYEFWVGYNPGNFSFIAGLHDLNSIFITSSCAGSFINSSFGISPGLSLNMPVSIFPATTFGGVVKYDNKRFSVLSGFYNMNYDFIDEEVFRLHNHTFRNGFLGIGEFQFRWYESENVTGELKIGGFFKNCNHDDHVEEEICKDEENYGAYLVTDRSFYFTGDKSVNAFIQLNLSPLKYSFASEYTGIGVTFNGFLTEKKSDIIGFAVARVKLNNLDDSGYYHSGTYETALELTYEQLLLKRIGVKPDIQYIMKPGGSLRNAFVFTIRMNLGLSQGI